jgi:hypothetical protein
MSPGRIRIGWPAYFAIGGELELSWYLQQITSAAGAKQLAGAGP